MEREIWAHGGGIPTIRNLCSQMYNRNVIRITCTIFDTVEIELSIFFKMTDGKNDKVKVDLGLLEEDDEFEEFPAEGIY